MGCGGGSKPTVPKQTDQSTRQNQMAAPGEGRTGSQSVTQSQQLQEVAPSGQSRKSSTTSLASAKPSSVSARQKQGSGKQSNKSSPDSSEDENSPRALNNKSRQGSIDSQLPPIDNPTGKPISPSSTISSPRAPLPLISRPQTGSDSISVSHTSSHRNRSATYRGKSNRCSQCPHCQRVAKETLHTPIPKWVIKNPGEGVFRIEMDDYDIDAIKEKAIFENGHVRGSYDYRTQLTIEKLDDYDPSKVNYYTQPFVAKTTPPRILPTRTPFPEYDVLQRHDRRINKPYTLSLFAD